MKKECIAMLLAGGQGSRLYVLTSNVAKPAVPFGGKYRIIDFPLSNCTNSGIDTVGVLTQYKPLELNSYIGSGQPWDLDRLDGGVHILPPYMQEGEKGSWYKGTANAIYQNIGFVDMYDPDYVVIGESQNYSLNTITKAINLVLGGAKLIGTNSDLTGPVENGIAPACRALTAPIELATGKSAYFVGKPNPLMMRTGLKLLGCHSGEAAMVGARMDTDIIAGIETGLDTVLVLSGVTNREDIDRYPFRPQHILSGVGEMAAGSADQP